MNHWSVFDVPSSQTASLLATLALAAAEEQVLKADSQRPIVVHHRTHQLTYVCDGGGEVYLDGVVRPISSGSLILMEPGVHHAFASDPSSDLRLRHMHWPPELVTTDREIIAERCEVFAPGAAR